MSINSAKNLLINGAVVYLRSKKTGFNLMIGNRGNVSAEECKDSDYGKFVVHVKPSGAIALQSKKLPHNWLAISNGIKGYGSGGVHCQFSVISDSHGFISLESVQTPGYYIGVTDAGGCKSQLNAGISDDEKFVVIPVDK